MSCPKAAELLELLFGGWTLVGPGNHVLDAGPRSGTFGGFSGPLERTNTVLLLSLQQGIIQSSMVYKSYDEFPHKTIPLGVAMKLLPFTGQKHSPKNNFGCE